MKTKILVCRALQGACNATHWLTNRRPWLWAFRQCPLARVSLALDNRWFPEGGGYWTHCP